MIDVYFLGKNCFRIKGKKTSILINPKEKKAVADDIILFTSKSLRAEFNNNDESKNTIIIDGPGEYEIKGVSVIGLTNSYKFLIDSADFFYIDNMDEKLSKEDFEEIDVVDVLITSLTKSTSETVSETEPKIIVPIAQQENQAATDSFVKSTGFEVQKVKSKFSFAKDKISEKTTIYIFE